MNTALATANAVESALYEEADHYFSFEIPDDSRSWLDSETFDFDVVSYACRRVAGDLSAEEEGRRHEALAEPGRRSARYVYAVGVGGVVRPLLIQAPEPLALCNDRGQLGSLEHGPDCLAVSYSLGVDALGERFGPAGLWPLQDHLAQMPGDQDWQVDAATIERLAAPRMHLSLAA